MSSVTTPKRFQQDAIDSAVKVLSSCLSDLKKVEGTANEKASRELLFANRGCILIEAPTGTGKTLMAGNAIEQLALKHKVIWFWFAPFAGLIEQTIKSIRRECRNLRVKDPTVERTLDNLRSGDIFVTTWQSVAVANAESRKIRQESETMMSLDLFIDQARALGFHIGAVIDESHHSFRGQTQASAFFHDVLEPSVAILATATPKDHDVEDFTRKNGIKKLNRIAIARSHGVDANLIKKGVKVAVFKAPQPGTEGLINFEQTAIRCGVAAHKRIKDQLTEQQLPVTPLLLVQFDKDKDHIIQWLKDLGFNEDGIKVHTAKEPDKDLMTIANDERVEVLLFKMAVATGFDAPRAFTLVSLRTSRDPDFGTQIVGRIMRVDRRLQPIQDLPETLRHGYVFLAYNEAQTGLSTAANRINAIKDELAEITDNIAIVSVGNEEPVAHATEKGQLPVYIPEPTPPPPVETENQPVQVPPVTETAEQQVLEGFELVPQSWTSGGAVPSATSERKTAVQFGGYSYPLRTDLIFPKAFRRAIIAPDQTNLLAEVVSLFRFDDALINVAQQSATRILMEQTEIFGNSKERTEEIQALLAQKEVDRAAQLTLEFANKDGMLDIRKLHEALEKQLSVEFGNRGLIHLQTKEQLRAGVNKILALRKTALKAAIIEATKRHVEVQDADPIPERICSDTQLDCSRLNVYGVYPSDLNPWERAFVEDLDNDMSDTVLWWHRNPPRKPYSVGIPLPGQEKQKNFFPDFIAGINGRTLGTGILLVETKRDLNDEEGNAQAKSKIEHPEYKKVMMLYWEREERWMVVEYDPTQDKNLLDRVWYPGLMVGY
ncbi:DEAD/DEAH box helicase [Geomonas agri]|uniref:DEAD/DEAH box helicase n=1 Tax=Geomonas agri TaxID=2873702 RepID=UPI001CD32DAC|nr:DEAD/DEAH box helicase family protein [Geomonas agri]